MPFQKGREKTGGRQPGSPNRFTRQIRQAILAVYDKLGGDDAFYAWAKESPGDFYKLSGRLIPGEFRDESDSSVTITIQQLTPTPLATGPTTITLPAKPHMIGADEPKDPA